MHRHLRQTLGDFDDNISQASAEGVGEANVPDNAVGEEGVWPHALGAIDDLVRDDKVAGGNVFLEGSDGGEGEDGADADGAEGGDVGEVGDEGGGDFVVGAVAGEEGDGGGGVGGGEDGDGGGGGAPGCGDGEAGDGREARVFEGGDACAADHGDADGSWGISKLHDGWKRKSVVYRRRW